MSTTGERVEEYFRVKSRQLLAAAQLPITGHSGLAGSHREELQRVYFGEVLPRRFTIGRGMVYGFSQRSREADIVIWDSYNYPSLPMLDHSFFFAESVRAVIESKSRWSRDDMRDVLLKSHSVRRIVGSGERTLEDQLTMLRLDVAALYAGVEHSGILRVPSRIGTVGVFLTGGAETAKRPDDLLRDVESIEDEWPDLLLFLEPGVLVVKEIDEDAGGQLAFFDLGEDALLAFTNGLLTLLADRSVLTEGPLYLGRYAPNILGRDPFETVDFATSPWAAPTRIPLWGS